MAKRSKPHLNKRQQFTQYQRGNRIATYLAVGGAIMVVLTIYVGLTRSAGSSAPVTLDPAQALPAGQEARLPAAQFNDGRARFYRYATSIGREVRLFVVRGSDGVIRAAFDACDVCYRERKGYHQEGDDMVCRNCGRHFRTVDVNVLTGGCNPAPLRRTVEGDQVVLRSADLDLGAVYF